MNNLAVRSGHFRLNTQQFMVALAILLFATLDWAAGETDRIDSGQWSTSKAVYVGTTHIGPGTYKFEAPENGATVFVERDGNLISPVPAYWVKLPQKAEQFKVITEKDQVVRIEFPDRSYAIQVL